jgi:hypothetical protein
MRLLVFFALLSASRAHANVLDGRAVLPHCQARNVDVPEACRAELPPTALAAILPVAEKAVKDEQVRQMKDYARARMTEELDASIRSREIMVQCLEKPGKDCRERIDALRRMLEENFTQLRLATAVSRIPVTLQDHSIRQDLSLPAAFGGTTLPPLSESELAFVLDLQHNVIDATEWIGISQLRRELGLSASVEELRGKCGTIRYLTDDEVCARIHDIHENAFVQFRRSMGKIRDSLISQLPLTIRFRKTPITDKDLHKELSGSLATLREWRKEAAKSTGKAEEKRLYDEMAFADEYVAKHPEFCAAAEENILSVGRKELRSSWLKTGRNIAFISAVCTGTTLTGIPYVCLGAGTALTAYGLNAKYSEWNLVRERLESADRENPQATLSSVQNKFRDLLVLTALSAVGTFTGVRAEFSGEAASLTAKAAAQSLEGEESSFYSLAGNVLEQFSTKAFGGLKSAAIGKTLMGAAEIAKPESATGYRQWLRSDAYTARVYEIFLRERFSGAK